ncbi:MAG: glycosyltransferase [Verrucomicrobia bacterium]|nr:glycosyltransferase [Verrucomicrobiota bacterium]
MSDPVRHQFRVSVIICAHQPDSQHLNRTLQALRAQTLSRAEWELLVVDNQSTPPLNLSDSLSWHPNARCVPEEILGLTPARCCGIHHTSAELIVFVDVDNVLHADYLAKALEIASKHPKVGVWSGQAHPEFEEAPADWTRPYWAMLAIREFCQDSVMMTFDPTQSLPHGAGMCVRREVASAYIKEMAATNWRLLLERKGQSLMSGGDSDLALLSMKLGWGVGHFTQLHLDHLIPRGRLTEPYLIRLKEAMAASGVVLDYFYREPTPARSSFIWNFFRWMKIRIGSSGIEKRMRLAQLTGELRGWCMVKSFAEQLHLA